MKLFGLVAYTAIAASITSTASAVDPVAVAALQALYSATNGGNWKTIHWTFDSGADPCGDNWDGVVCVGDDITEISLYYNNLVGTIPSELGQITSLIHLGLGNNGLTGLYVPFLLSAMCVIH